MRKRSKQQVVAMSLVSSGWTSSLRGWVNGVLTLLFPPSCQVCGTNALSAGTALCRQCLQSIAFIRSPLCSCCGREMADSAGGDHLCGPCLQNPPPYSSARGVALYQEPVSSLLHRLKYQGDTSVLPALQEISSLHIPFLMKGDERIVPVPLHVSRLRKRGFNQAILLAEGFFPKQKNLILRDTLVRIRQTVSQTGLDGAARRKNLHRAFTVRHPERVKGRRIVLVDDVFTTGTTASECSRMLLRAGAEEVHIVTLARVRQ